MSDTRTARVVYDFVPQQEDELSVQKGDIVIIVTENVTAEWHRCAKDGVQGLVPANFLLFEVSKRSRRKSGKDMFAMALSSLPEVQTSIITGDNNTNTDDVRRVLFDYVASASDELTISAGTRVTVLNEDVDDGWCMVRICSSPSSDGLLPENYLSPATSATTTEMIALPPKTTIEDPEEEDKEEEIKTTAATAATNKEITKQLRKIDARSNEQNNEITRLRRQIAVAEECQGGRRFGRGHSNQDVTTARAAAGEAEAKAEVLRQQLDQQHREMQALQQQLDEQYHQLLDKKAEQEKQRKQTEFEQDLATPSAPPAPPAPPLAPLAPPAPDHRGNPFNQSSGNPFVTTDNGNPFQTSLPSTAHQHGLRPSNLYGHYGSNEQSVQYYGGDDTSNLLGRRKPDMQPKPRSSKGKGKWYR
tara:strand:+ start:557 stop:1807 length:1251 start_codon:yes stop_codon:yes gene_type:complete